VITTAANGVSEIMTPGVHGEVISEPSDIDRLSSELRKWLGVMNDPAGSDQALQVRSACSKLASEFTLERNLRETLAVIRKVIAEKREI
jgi:glycosyltransferase involved in cell wall biosynthesis